MKKRSFRSTFVSVILVITVAISIVNLVSLDFLIHLADVMGKHQENPGILEKKQKRFLRNLMI